MLFKPEHKDMILKGKKTATRRVWKKRMVKEGGVYKCKLKMLSKDYFAKIVVMEVYEEQLKDMDDEDAKSEGYKNMEAFKEIWIKINGSWNPKQEVTVIRFLRVSEMEVKHMKGYCLDCGSEKIGMKEEVKE